jgi:hypothetical protein
VNVIRSHHGADVTVRHAETGDSVRAQQTGTELMNLPLQMTGHFAVTNQWTTIRSEGDPFLERLASGGLRRALSEDPVPLVMWAHGRDNFIQQRPLGVPASLAEDNKGGAYAVDLFNTMSVRELAPALASGVLGASFRFAILDESWVDRPSRSSWNPRGLPERTIRDVSILEFGPCPIGAYRGATAGIAPAPKAPMLAAASSHLLDTSPSSRRPSWYLPTAKPRKSYLTKESPYL